MKPPDSRTAEQHEHDAGPPPVDAAFVDALVERLGRSPEATLPILQALQAHYRYLPEEALRRVCELTGISAASLTGVASFYSQFRRQPTGRHLVSVCHGTACHVKGAERVTEALRRELHIPPDGDTDPDGVFTVQRVACLGCCTLAPVLQIDDVTYGHVTPATVGVTLKSFLEHERQRHDRAARPAVPRSGHAEIRVGTGSCCVAGGAADVREAIEDAVRALAADARVVTVGCVGMCHNTPLVEVRLPDGTAARYARVRAVDAAAIVRRHLRGHSARGWVSAAVGATLDRLLPAPGTAGHVLDAQETAVRAFLDPQVRLSTEHSGELDPLDLDAYLAGGGFAGLDACLRAGSPEAVIAAVTAAGLRGRGGAGFPAGRKWAAVRAAPGDVKYVVLNGDEGDPGAFMDRMLLESYPYRVLEGMAIAAFAVGAGEGILYIRAEYPLAVQRIREAIRRCEARGILGVQPAGSSGACLPEPRHGQVPPAGADTTGTTARKGTSLRLRVAEGAGAFVCGEETALLASLMGRRGMPRLRPPYPSESGFRDRPTLINNVETCALVPWIVRHGEARFAALGTAASKGTKVFALTGKVQRGGLIEVPMGVTIRRIVEEMGGGAAPGRVFKAVQIGGPSGGCLPAAMADIPVDYEALTAAGAMMGSGGLVVMDDTDCMVDMARYFLAFTQRESCGRCTFCRVGTRRMLDLIERLCAGHGAAGDLERLEALARGVKRGSLCGLGQTAPNPVLTTLRYFRPEYEAHLRGECPAGSCRALIVYVIGDACIGCTKCSQACPVQAIPATPYRRHVIDAAKCTRCGTCHALCPERAIRIERAPRPPPASAERRAAPEERHPCPA